MRRNKKNIDQVVEAIQSVDGVAGDISEEFARSLFKSFEKLGLPITGVHTALQMAIGREKILSPKERAKYRDKAIISAADATKLALELCKHSALIASKVGGTAIPVVGLFQRLVNLGTRIREKNPLAITSETIKIVLTATGIALIPVTAGGSAAMIGLALAMDGGELAYKVVDKINSRHYQKTVRAEIKLDSRKLDDNKAIQKITDAMAKAFLDDLEAQKEKAVLLADAKRYQPQTKMGQQTSNWFAEENRDRTKSVVGSQKIEMDSGVYHKKGKAVSKEDDLSDLFAPEPVKVKPADDFRGIELTDFSQEPSKSPLQNCSLLTQQRKSQPEAPTKDQELYFMP